MDFRLVVALMILAMIMDLVGRMAKKRREMIAPGQDAPAGGLGNLVQSAMVDERLPGSQARAVPAERIGLPAPGSDTGEVPAILPARTWTDPAERVPVPVDRHPVREARVLELRDRAPRALEVRSRDPRASGREPAAKPLPLPEAPREPSAPLPLPEAPREPSAPLPQSPERGWARVRATPMADLGDRLDLGSPGALRRAVLAREVLGPPLALRDEDGN